MQTAAERAYHWQIAQRVKAEDVLDKLKDDNHPVWQDKDRIRSALAFALRNLNQAVGVLAEFAEDVEAVGVDELRGVGDPDPTRLESQSWPDLADTYDRARTFLEGT